MMSEVFTCMLPLVGGKFGRIYVGQLIDSGGNFASGSGADDHRRRVDGFCRIPSGKEVGGWFYRGDTGSKVYRRIKGG